MDQEIINNSDLRDLQPFYLAKYYFYLLNINYNKLRTLAAACTAVSPSKLVKLASCQYSAPLIESSQTSKTSLEG